MRKPGVDQFIDGLVTEHKKLSVLPSTWKLVTLSIVFLVVMNVGLFQTLHPHFLQNLMKLGHTPSLVIQFLVSLMIMGSLSYWSFKTLIPGSWDASSKIPSKNWFYLSLALFVFMLQVTMNMNDPRPMGYIKNCVFQVLGFSLLSFVPYLVVFRKSSFYSDKKFFFGAAFAGAAVPAVFMQIICIKGGLHAILFHYLPMVLVGFFFFLGFKAIQRFRS